MTYLTGESSVIHDWTKIDFVNFVYNGAYFTGGTGTSLINGTTITCVPGLNLNVIINEENTLPDGRFLLLGNPKTKFTGSFSDVASDEYISKYSFYFLGNDIRQYFNFSTIPIVSTMTGSMSVSSYVKVDGDHGVDGYIIENYASGTGFGLGYDNSPDRWRFRVGLSISGLEDVHTTVLSPKTTGAGEWINLTGVWNTDTKEMRIYVNGIFAATHTAPDPADVLEGSTEDIRIGAGSTSVGEMKGLINNVVVWNTALSDDEVLTHFKFGSPYNVLVEGPKKENIVFWSKVGDDSKWNGINRWTIKDEVGNISGPSSITGGGGFLPFTYSSRVIDAPE